ncbi:MULTISPECIES: YhgE/Pip domain-containing protein [Pontibacillus]|uniref:YhgE/Pip domain-containing protein n=1 Tax=Pontibacillus chungwhensis TaxID=265426 RepID=A0ABY8V182_9BACI|nr:MULTISPECIES: YhgE/Pip domain-containing protein [Pontibacillus]MCD5322220.1 YhgE/Pip domain-containing protein [Pontibacillus sp. HN14]WIF99514.1 YhgE/Pip domain-containing protein [Pontibacillus chungwhensis]
MKAVWNSFTRDWKSIATNWVAMVLIGGLIILPSLYAWFNIDASWDPYSQTDQLPVGIVNEDKGATVRDQQIDVGERLVDTLKENKKFDWHFTDQPDAMEKLEYGDYYAVIVIPENFSQKLATVVQDRPEKAEVAYYVNEKINAIAPKITNKGASVIVDQITSSFISEVNGRVAELFNQLGVELEKDLPDIKRFEEYVFKLEENLPKIHDLISGAYSDSKEAEGVINDVQALIPQAQNVTEQGLTSIDETTSFLSKAEERLNELAPKVKEDLKTAQETADEVNAFLKEIQSTDIDLSKGQEIQKKIDSQLADSISQVQNVQQILKQVQEEPPEGEQANGETSTNNEAISNALADLDTITQGLKALQETNGKIETFLIDKQKSIEATLADLQETSESTSNRIGDFLKEYNESIEPTVISEVASAKDTLAEARSILSEAQSTIPRVDRILNNTEKDIDEGQGILEYMLNEYPYVNEKVNRLADRIREIQGETDINKLIELLKNDPKAEQSFFEDPIMLRKNALFPIENYGTGMTPFYTVLSLWVGALLLVSLLTTDPVHGEEYRIYERYFGKLATFVSIGILQTLVVTLGNLYLLRIDIADPLYFILFGMVVSVVFMTIVYTLVSVLGDVGKAAAIVILVLQIAGSGGTYPVALLPEFFQTIHPFLPFSYAVDLLREAVGGIVDARVKTDLLFLTGFWVLFIVIGAFLKGPLHKGTRSLMEKSRKSGMFH